MRTKRKTKMQKTKLVLLLWVKGLVQELQEQPRAYVSHDGELLPLVLEQL
jgi:hypothetical protein